MPTEIREFLESYRDAFNRLDGEAVARLYAIPSGIVDDSGFTYWPTFEPIRENMVALCELYRKNGFVEAHFEPFRFFDQGENHAVADLSWHVDRIEGNEPWQFNTTYNLRRTTDGWRVLLCTAYSEKKLDVSSET